MLPPSKTFLVEVRTEVRRLYRVSAIDKKSAARVPIGEIMEGESVRTLREETYVGKVRLEFNASAPSRIL